MQLSQVVVEQDHKWWDVRASKWFGFPTRVTVHVGDGVEYVKQAAALANDDVTSQGIMIIVFHHSTSEI